MGAEIDRLEVQVEAQYAADSKYVKIQSHYADYPELRACSSAYMLVAIVLFVSV